MPTTQITITMDDTGRVSVTAPIEQKVLCYGLLEVAKEVIRDTFAANQKLVQPANVVPHEFGRKQ